MDKCSRMAFDKLRLSGSCLIVRFPLVLSLSKDSHEDSK